MPYNPTPTPGWVTLRSRTALETAMESADLNGNELARRAKTSRQNIANIRRGRTGKIREDIAGRIERALGLGRGELFQYPPTTSTASTASTATSTASARSAASPAEVAS